MIKRNEGQSAIEFLMSFVFVIGFMMTLVRIAMNYTNGYLVHYATYVSSRAFMVADNNGQGSDADSYAALKARNTFKRFNFSAFTNNFDSQLNINTADSMDDLQTNLYVGVYVD